MSRTQPTETNIHLRARMRDRDLIDQAAELSGTNRTQFIMSTALREAKDVLLDQTTLLLDAESFGRVLDELDGHPSREAAAGMKRLAQVKAPWPGE